MAVQRLRRSCPGHLLPALDDDGRGGWTEQVLAEPEVTEPILPARGKLSALHRAMDTPDGTVEPEFLDDLFGRDISSRHRSLPLGRFCAVR